ncbi:MAG: magnesium transporter [bacterium]|jgi:magnesium transporter|nr:magnesium transporter [Betaproteobacteria bacterium]
MADVDEPRSVQESLQEIMDLLRRQRVVESLAHREGEGRAGGLTDRQPLVDSLVHKQNEAELQSRLDALHPADVALILEALPLDDRLRVWQLVKADRDGEILLEVSDAVRETLIADMDRGELVAATEQLDTDEIADLAPDLPDEVIADLFKSLSADEREQLREALSYPEDSVGGLMDFEMVTIREDVTIEVVLRYLRRLDELPSNTDKLFVVDRKGLLRGVLPLKKLLVNEPEIEVATLVDRNVVSFHPDDDARDAATAFERYDLISAPVVDDQGEVLGRLTVDVVVDFIREASEAEKLKASGLREEEDIFAPVWDSLKNRWTWLAVNLVTAFIASRVIGAFEGSIEKLVALAALMPIVAGIGGNAGNQTITMIVRALALGQISRDSARKLFIKEITIALINGVVWGSIVGGVVWLFYGSIPLSVVIMAAMTLNLLLAALAGVLIPLGRRWLQRDPAMGSSVLITALTDSGGFFIFLGLATLFLV